MNFTEELEQARQLVERRLAEFFPGAGLESAMRYSLLAGGKRIRPILTMKFSQAAGGTMEEALDFGCAVEMLHTYSLIHDDLPCMDNDDLRRGKPTNHKVYGEWVATLAGDALQAEAFRTVLLAEGAWGRNGVQARAMAAVLLAEAAGYEGMCGGQYRDTAGDGQPHTVEELTEINDKKTGALLRAACQMGIAAALGRRDVDAACMDAARDYATELGLAFQIRDDMLDVAGDASTFGKPIGSDAANGKTTYVTLLGLEACETQVLEHTQRAKEALERVAWAGDTAFLRQLADSLALRNT